MTLFVVRHLYNQFLIHIPKEITHYYSPQNNFRVGKEIILLHQFEILINLPDLSKSVNRLLPPLLEPLQCLVPCLDRMFMSFQLDYVQFQQ